uniref:Synaptotagmin XIa n=1 Tax=Myripristis murdjan TaxID=586833 RepID=A0A667XHP3_9TELE
MAEITHFKPTYEVSPVLAGFLGAGVLVVSATVAVFLWTCCQRQYRQLRGSYKLQSGICDSQVDPPYKFIHMLKGISIYPETLSNKKIVRVQRRAGSCVNGGSWIKQSHKGGTGSGRSVLENTTPEVGLFSNSPPLERALPVRADYCCLDSKTASHLTPVKASVQPTTMGTLVLAVDYNFPKKALVVTIVGAHGLPVMDELAGSSDPYVKMIILPEKKHRVKTRVLRKTLEPLFDETFTFYGIDYGSLPNLILYFLVLSFDRYAHDDVIGEVSVPLAGVDPRTGQVHISQNITKRHIQSVSRGELLVSLSYQPNSQRLSVLVMKAKHLPSLDITGMPGNPYVKVNIHYGHKRIAKKKTHVKKCTLNPVFNESFIVKVPAELLTDVSMEFLLVDFNRTIKNEVVGRLVLGGQSHMPTGATHWREVCDNPGRQIAKWHNLDEY